MDSQCHSWTSRCNACPAPGSLGGGREAAHNHTSCLPVQLPRSEAVKCNVVTLIPVINSTSQFLCTSGGLASIYLAPRLQPQLSRSFGSRPSLHLAWHGKSDGTHIPGAKCTTFIRRCFSREFLKKPWRHRPQPCVCALPKSC